MNLLVRVEGWLSALLLFVAALLGLLTVVLRYLAGINWLWAQGVVVMLTVWGALLAGAIAIHNQDHLSLDLAVKHLPARLRKVSAVVKHVLITLFTASLLYLSARYFWFLLEFGGTSLSTYLPKWLEFSGVLVALLLMTIHGVWHVIWDFTKG